MTRNAGDSSGLHFGNSPLPSRMPSPQPCAFWLIEDHLTFRGAVKASLEMAGFACTGSFSSCEEALAALPAAAGLKLPDVILLDVGLPGMDGIEGLRRFREAVPQAALLILTVFEEDEKIFRAICAGASGYLLKTAPVEEISAAIHDVLAGGSPMNSRIARRVLTMFSRLAPAKNDYGLTPREKGILQLMVDGNIKKEIAAALDVSVHTVNTHMRHIYEKLQVHTGTKAVAKALQERLL